MMAEKSTFFNHLKCHRPKFTHVMFADDLVIFSNGWELAVKEVHAAVNEFLVCSGLTVNV